MITLGDENSLQGRTQAHKHESASSTGGFLETGLTGMTNLSNGSMMYGDASEQVTELNSGNLGDVLTMGATLPSWSASVPATGTFELVDTVELSGTATLIDSSFTSISGADISCLMVVYDLSSDNSTADFSLQYGTGGALVTSNYYSRCFSLGSVTTVTLNNTASWLLQRNPNQRHQGGVAYIYVADPSMVASNNDMLFTSTGSNSDPSPQNSGGTNDSDSSSIDQVRITCSAGSLQIGSRMSVYRLNR